MDKGALIAIPLYKIIQRDSSVNLSGIPQYVVYVGVEPCRRPGEARWVEGVFLVGSHAGGGSLRNKSRMDAQQVAGRAGNGGTEGGDGGTGNREGEFSVRVEAGRGE